MFIYVVNKSLIERYHLLGNVGLTVHVIKSLIIFSFRHPTVTAFGYVCGKLSHTHAHLIFIVIRFIRVESAFQHFITADGMLRPR